MNSYRTEGNVCMFPIISYCKQIIPSASILKRKKNVNNHLTFVFATVNNEFKMTLQVCTKSHCCVIFSQTGGNENGSNHSTFVIQWKSLFRISLKTDLCGLPKRA